MWRRCQLYSAWHNKNFTTFASSPLLQCILIMATPRSKTLSRTDLNAWCNAAIGRAFGHNLSIADIAHVFDLSQRQVRHLKVKWRATGDLTLAPIVGCPRIASCILVCTVFIPEESTDQSCLYCCPAELWGRSLKKNRRLSHGRPWTLLRSWRTLNSEHCQQ